MKRKTLKTPLALILAISIEVLLLILILLVIIVGVLGIFLPVLPGLFLFVLAAGIYSLLIRSDYGRITSRAHPHLVGIFNKIIKLRITKNFMGLFKKRKQKKVKEEILKHGLILLGFNTALILAFFFGFVGLSILASLLKLGGLWSAVIPLLVIFIFAGASSIVWYRFGQILGRRIKSRKMVNFILVVLISILPFLAVVILLSGLFGLAGIFRNAILTVIFLGLLLMSILASVFEMLVVTLGGMSPRIK